MALQKTICIEMVAMVGSSGTVGVKNKYIAILEIGLCQSCHLLPKTLSDLPGHFRWSWQTVVDIICTHMYYSSYPLAY